MSAVILIAVAVFIVALLTLSGTSVRTVSRMWLRHWIEHQHSSAGRMTLYLERPMRLVHAAGTGIALTVFLVGALIVVRDGGSRLALIRDTVIFFLIIAFAGQLIPRAIARRWAPKLVPYLVPVLHVVDVIVTPFLFVAAKAAAIIVPPSRRKSDNDLKEGLDDLLRDGAFEGMKATEEMAIISGVMQFGEKTVGDVMTPRDEVFMLDATLDPLELAKEVANSAFSRVPLYRESRDNITGMLYAFDVFRLTGVRAPPVRPVVEIHPTRPANALMFDLLRSRRQMAIVRDDSGAVLGIVTMEDLLEELVGDIRDEHDEPAATFPSPHRVPAYPAVDSKAAMDHDDADGVNDDVKGRDLL